MLLYSKKRSELIDLIDKNKNDSKLRTLCKRVVKLRGPENTINLHK